MQPTTEPTLEPTIYNISNLIKTSDNNFTREQYIIIVVSCTILSVLIILILIYYHNKINEKQVKITKSIETQLTISTISGPIKSITSDELVKDVFDNVSDEIEMKEINDEEIDDMLSDIKDLSTESDSEIERITKTYQQQNV